MHFDLNVLKCLLIVMLYKFASYIIHVLLLPPHTKTTDSKIIIKLIFSPFVILCASVKMKSTV